MLSIVNALIPVILIIALGKVLKCSSLFSDESWSGFENLCYFVLFPALLIKTLATAKLGTTEMALFSGMVLFAIFAMSGLDIISRTYSVVLFSLQDIFIIFPYADISNDCNCSCFW